MTKIAAPDHAQLEDDVRRAVDGDVAARDRVMRVLLPVLDAHLFRFRLSPEDRLDVLQNSLIRLQQRLGDYRGDARFATWAIRVTHNEALMYLRSQRRHRVRLVEGEIDLDAIGEPEPEELFEGTAVRSAVETLPPVYQRVLTARYADDQPLEIIARDLRTTRSSVRASLMRARRMLRGRLQKAGILSFAHARAEL